MFVDAKERKAYEVICENAYLGNYDDAARTCISNKIDFDRLCKIKARLDLDLKINKTITMYECGKIGVYAERLSNLIANHNARGTIHYGY